MIAFDVEIIFKIPFKQPETYLFFIFSLQVIFYIILNFFSLKNDFKKDFFFK